MRFWYQWLGVIVAGVSIFSFLHHYWSFGMGPLVTDLVAFYGSIAHPVGVAVNSAIQFLFERLSLRPPKIDQDIIILYLLISASYGRSLFSRRYSNAVAKRYESELREIENSLKAPAQANQNTYFDEIEKDQDKYSAKLLENFKSRKKPLTKIVLIGLHAIFWPISYIYYLFRWFLLDCTNNAILFLFQEDSVSHFRGMIYERFWGEKSADVVTGKNTSFFMLIRLKGFRFLSLNDYKLSMFEAGINSLFFNFLIEIVLALLICLAIFTINYSEK